MTERPEEVLGAPRVAAPEGRRRTVMSGRDLAILRSLASRIDPEDAGAHNNLGVVFFQKGLIEDAVDAFERALELDPRLAVARRNAEIVYLRSGHLRRRVRELSQTLESDPRDAIARDALARTYLLGGDAEGAAREWRTLLAGRPTSTALHMKLAYAEAELGDLEEAGRLLDRAIELAPEEPALQLQRAELLRDAGDGPGALAAIDRALELEPALARAHALASRIHYVAGRMEEAEAARERAARLDPGVLDEERHLSLDRYLSANAARADREPESVAATLGRYTRAGELRRTGDYRGAIRELERALDEGEDALEVQQALAELRLLEGALERAAEAYEHLLEARSESPKIWNERGVVLHRLGRLEDALEAYRKAVALDARYGLGWNNLGVALAQAGETGAAERALRKAADGDVPVEVLWNLSLHLGLENRPAEAVDVCRHAVELDESQAESWSRLGGALFQAGIAREARDALLTALELEPDLAEARYQLGFALSALGDYPGALRETKRALDLDPLYPAPRFRLLIDVQFEEGSLPAPDPERVERLAPGEQVREFTFEPGSLDEAFSALTAPPPAEDDEVERLLEEGRLLHRRGQLLAASDLAARAVGLAPESLEALTLQADVFLDRGLAGEALERYDAVLYRLEGSGPGAARAYAGAARCLLALGRPLEAVENARDAGEHGAPDGVSLLARSHLAAGETDRALSAYEILVARGQPGAPDLVGYGTALLEAGRPADAEPVFRRALTLDGDAVAGRVGLGRALKLLGRASAAEEEFRIAVEGLPSYGEAVLELGEARWRKGARQEALRSLIDFLQLDPTHVPALIRLGTWLYELGRGEQASKSLERALRFEPENLAARVELDRVRGRGVEV